MGFLDPLITATKTGAAKTGAFLSKHKGAIEAGAAIGTAGASIAGSVAASKAASAAGKGFSAQSPAQALRHRRAQKDERRGRASTILNPVFGTQAKVTTSALGGGRKSGGRTTLGG